MFLSNNTKVAKQFTHPLHHLFKLKLSKNCYYFFLCKFTSFCVWEKWHALARAEQCSSSWLSLWGFYLLQGWVLRPVSSLKRQHQHQQWTLELDFWWLTLEHLFAPHCSSLLLPFYAINSSCCKEWNLSTLFNLFFSSPDSVLLYLHSTKCECFCWWHYYCCVILLIELLY